MAVLLPASVTLLLILFAVSGECGRSHGQIKKEPQGGHSHEQDTVKTTPAVDYSNAPFTINVTVTNQPTQTYSTNVTYRGILLGGMRRLQKTNQNFTFTTSESSDYGPFLESVNGLYGNFSQRTYWQLKVQKPDGSVIIPDVGIGCYIPTANDVIILNYTKYCKV